MKLSLLILLLLLPISAEAIEITVNQGDSIQEAIDASSEGDTIVVLNATYYENIIISKRLILYGLGAPVVDADSEGNPFTLSSDGIVLKGFTATHAGRDGAGIYVTSSNNIIESNNAIENTDNSDGIKVMLSENNTLIGNKVSHNSRNGISVSYSSNNTLKENDVESNNDNGIEIDYSNNNTIIGNNISYNYGMGIELMDSANNIISGNNASFNNWYGIRVENSAGNIISLNRAGSNIRGIDLDFSNNNRLTCNAFVDNLERAHDDGLNQWDDGQKGNYYDDHSCVDNNGDNICDSSYAIDGGDNIDRYPLASWENIVSSHVQIVGPDGGIIDLGEGIRIVFPEGTFDKDTEITSKLDPSALLRNEIYDGVVLDVKVPIEKLKKPAEIRIALPSYITSENGTTICGTINDEGDILIVNSSKVDFSSGRPELVLSTDHFSKTFFQWLKERFLMEPFSSDPLLVPYYEQSGTKFCWAASTLMICQAANYKEDAQVFSIIGKMGIPGEGMNILRARWGSGLSGYIEGHTGIKPEIRYWDRIGIRQSGGSNIRGYIHRELAYNHNPVMVFDFNKGHSYVIVGYKSDKEFYVHDSQDPRASASISSLRKMNFNDNLGLLTAVVPKDIRDSNHPITVGLNDRSIIFKQADRDPKFPGDEQEIGSSFIFIWDYTNPQGWSIINTKNEKAESLPDNIESITITKANPNTSEYGITITNSDRNSTKEILISLEFVAENRGSSKPGFSITKRISVSPLSVTSLSVDPIKFKDVYNDGIERYKFWLTAYDQAEKIVDTGFNYVIKPSKLEIIRPFSEGETGIAGIDYLFQVKGEGIPKDAEYEWDFGDGGYENGPAISHHYSSEREYMVRVTATWKDGSSEAETMIGMKAYDPEIIRPFSAEEVGLAGADYEFRIKGKTPKGVKYEWDFGDGNHASGPVVSHSFASGGEYWVEVEAIADNGTWEKSSATVILIKGVDTYKPDQGVIYGVPE